MRLHALRCACFREVIPEAFEMVEEGFVIEQDFPQVHVHQCRNAAHAQQPGLLVEQAVADKAGQLFLSSEKPFKAFGLRGSYADDGGTEVVNLVSHAPIEPGIDR